MSSLFEGVIRIGLVLVFVGGGLLSCGPLQEREGEWSYFGGDRAYQRYSPLTRIHHGNVADLEILWRRPAMDPELAEEYPEAPVGSYLLSTPILVDGILYAPNAVGLVVAFDPGTGETIWRQEPFEPTLEEVVGRSNRGLDYWADGEDRRLLHTRGEHLYALDAGTGEPISDFGEGGRVLLTREGPDALPFSWTAGPIVVDDVIVIGGMRGGAGDRSRVKEREPEDITGWDVRTGEHLWTFHVVPRPGEYGHETWGDGSWEYAGDAGSWCCLSADEELGHVYVPLSAPTGFYGAWRPGDNLFSNSLVALDAATGERVWHFQMTRHGIWEYENQGPPIVGDITVEGRRIPAVMQPNKTAFLFVFDRETGEPVWPIEDRPVPPSTVPGEVESPTQPFPTKPAPFDRQGLSEDDLIDFTPEVRAEAEEFVAQFVTGPLYTPPSLLDEEPGGTRGTLSVPGSWGAGNWNTGAFDPETGMYYAVSHTLPGMDLLVEGGEDATMRYVRTGDSPVFLPSGLPVTKPPYGRITAIDMSTGEHAWMVPNGEGPRDHPLLEDLDLPPLGIPGRPVPLVTGSLLFLGEGSNAIIGIDEGMWGRTFRAYDKATGEVVWETELPSGTTSQPMTYLHEGRQYLVVPIGERGQDPEWIALGLP